MQEIIVKENSQNEKKHTKTIKHQEVKKYVEKILTYERSSVVMKRCHIWIPQHELVNAILFFVNF